MKTLGIILAFCAMFTPLLAQNVSKPNNDDKQTTGIVAADKSAIIISTPKPIPAGIVITQDDLKKAIANNPSSTSNTNNSRQPVRTQNNNSTANNKVEKVEEVIKQSNLNIKFNDIELTDSYVTVDATLTNNSEYTIAYWEIGLTFKQSIGSKIYDYTNGSEFPPKTEVGVSFSFRKTQNVKRVGSSDFDPVLKEVIIYNKNGKRQDATNYFSLKERRL
jgi:hypothetical protein